MDERPRPLKVLFLTVGFGGGGAERFVSNALATLDRDLATPSVAVLREASSYPVPAGIEPVVLGKTRPCHIPRAIRGLVSHIERDRPDVLISALTFLNVLAGLALLFARHRPAWIARVAAVPEQEEAGVYGILNGLLYRRANAIITVSEGVKTSLQRHYPACADRVAVLRTAADHHRLQALAEDAHEVISLHHPALVAMGRLSGEKRYDVLLQALAMLHLPSGPHLYLLGDGPQRMTLEQMAQDLGVADRVHFLGFLDNPFPWIARSDLFVLTSDFEGLSNALVEAQSLGVPAVATDCPYGTRETFDHGVSGLLVPTGDAAAVASAITELLGDEQRRRRMGEAARRTSRERFSAERLRRDLSTLLLRVAPAEPQRADQSLGHEP
jgi:glycosyltransferase involved in cell wall biosynthesis